MKGEKGKQKKTVETCLDSLTIKAINLHSQLFHLCIYKDFINMVLFKNQNQKCQKLAQKDELNTF